MSKFILSTIFLLLAACSSRPREHVAEGGRSQTGQPALHAIHNEQLHELMTRMDNLMQERFMTETQLDEERRKYARKIADSAQALSQTVTAIIAKMPELALSPTEQPTFMALASKLQQQTDTLHELARQNHIDAIDDSLHQINTTCTSCHALFRKTGN